MAAVKAWKGADVRSLRIALGLSQRELAERLGVAKDTVWRWEAGRNNPQRVVWPLLSALEDEARARRIGYGTTFGRPGE